MAKIKEEKISSTRVKKSSVKTTAKPRVATVKAHSQTVEKKPESLAMIHHVHAVREPKKIRLGQFKALRIQQYFEKNPTLWGICWSFIWRVFVLVFAIKFVASILTSLIVVYGTDLLAKFL